MTRKHGYILLGVLGLGLGLGLVLVIQTFQAAHEANCRLDCCGNLELIALALDSYHSAYKSLPLAIERTSDGKLWRSWRTQIYPTYMQQVEMFYDPSSAWDSPDNLRLLTGTPIPLQRKDSTPHQIILDRVPWAFACPTSHEKKRDGSSYVAITGDGTAFPPNRALALSDIHDGPENTILVVESTHCRPDWTEPRDLDFDTMSFKINDTTKPSISSDHTGGAYVCFADGVVAFLTADASEVEVRAMLTVAGSENISRQELRERRVLKW